MLLLFALLLCAPPALAVAAAAASSSPPLPPPSEAAVEAGRQQYEMAVGNSRMPRFGDCWTSALRRLDAGCRSLTDEEQARMALHFARCFLAKSGRDHPECEEEKTVAECLRGADNVAFNAYTAFFTHTHNMCQFLQGQAWQSETSATVSRLSASSSRVAAAVEEAAQRSEETARAMEEAAKAQERLAHGQREALEFQRKVVENGTLLSRALETSRNNVKEILEEFKTSTDEQKMLIFEIFDRVAKLQSLLLSEISWLYTVFFYGACLVIAYLITATRRTADARLWLYLTLTVNFLLERAVCQWSLAGGAEEGEVDATEGLSDLLYHRVWLLRKASMSLSCLVTAYFACAFVDYNRVNHRLLEDIHRQNAELRRRMEDVQVAARARGHVGASGDDEEDGVARGGAMPLVSGVHALDRPSSGYESGLVADAEDDDDDSDSSDSTLSFNSTRTDHTWTTSRAATEERDMQLSEEESEDDDDDGAAEASFLSALLPASSRNPSPTSQTQAGGGAIVDVRQDPDSSLASRASVVRSRRGRSSTPLAAAPSHSYNLRKRRSAAAAAAGDQAEVEESPESFMRKVKEVVNINRRNAAKVRMAARKSALH